MRALFFIRRAAVLATCGLLLSGVALAGDPILGDELALVQEVEAVADTTLAEARGGASLPGGLGVEVSALMRVLADGEDILAISGGVSAAAHGVAAQEMVLQSQHLPATGQALNNPLIMNSLDNISLEQYREITIHLQNVPGVGTARPIVPVVPSLTIPGIPRLYVF